MIDPTQKKILEESTNELLSLDIEVLEKSFTLLSPNFKSIVTHFYAELLTHYPDMRPLFSHLDMVQQEAKMIHTIEVVIMSLRKPDQLLEVIKELGFRHQGYGAKPEDFEHVNKTLLHVMSEFAAKAWTAEVENAWEIALQTISKIMIAAYRKK